jgi:hypothetical protein
MVSMAMETEDPGIPRSTSLSNDLDLKVMEFARKRGLVRVERSRRNDNGQLITTKSPNVSEAIRVIITEYFTIRETYPDLIT